MDQKQFEQALEAGRAALREGRTSDARRHAREAFLMITGPDIPRGTHHERNMRAATELAQESGLSDGEGDGSWNAD